MLINERSTTSRNQNHAFFYRTLCIRVYVLGSTISNDLIHTKIKWNFDRSKEKKLKKN